MIFLRQVTSTAKASAMKEVRCEHCGTVYHYRHNAVGKAKRISVTVMHIDPFSTEEQAAKAADRVAKSVASRGVGPVACPKCRRLQENMVPILRRQYIQKFEITGILLPMGLAVVCLGTALLCTNFFDDALRGMPAVFVTVLAIFAIALFVQFGVRPRLDAQEFSVMHAGSVVVPLGNEGPIAAHDAGPVPGRLP